MGLTSGEEKDIPDHDLMKLKDKPNPTQDGASFVHSAVSFRLISGNSYIQLNNGALTETGAQDYGNFNDVPLELWQFRPDRTKVIPGTRGTAGYHYRSECSSGELFFPANELTGESNILHWKTFNPLDDYYGLSPIQAALKGIDTYEKTVDWNKALLDNGGRPSGALIWKGEGRMSDDTFRMFKNEVDEKISNKQKRGKPLVLPGNVDWKDLSLSPRDMDFLNSKDTSSRDISRVFKIPPILLNIGSDSTFSNMKEARLALWDDAVIPMLMSYVSMLNNHVAPRYGSDIRVKLDLSDVTALEPRREGLWERAEKASGYLTINEQRKMVGLEETDDGDVILVNASQIPLSFAATGLNDDPPPAEDGKTIKKKPLS
jgi:HK97 family phage portal protein